MAPLLMLLTSKVKLWGIAIDRFSLETKIKTCKGTFNTAWHAEACVPGLKATLVKPQHSCMSPIHSPVGSSSSYLCNHVIREAVFPLSSAQTLIWDLWHSLIRRSEWCNCEPRTVGGELRSQELALILAGGLLTFGSTTEVWYAHTVIWKQHSTSVWTGFIWSFRKTELLEHDTHSVW